MNKASQKESFGDDLSGTLGQAVAAICAEPIDEGRVARLIDQARSHAEIVLSRFSSARKTCWPPMASYAAVAAALLLIAAFAFWNHALAPRAWADVVNAVRQQPWIRAHATIDTGEEFEIWFSATHQIFATRAGKTIAFFDLGKETIDLYAGNPTTITRLPRSQSDNTGSQAFLTMFAAFLAGDARRTIDVGDTKIVFDGEQARDEGALEYQFHWETPDAAADGTERKSQMTLLVDRETRLPFAWKTTWSHLPPGLPAAIEYTVDYPTLGPASIYDLGVPKSVEVVDRVPHGELADILKGVETEILTFDPYYEVAVAVADGQPWWRAMMIHRVWKSGKRWRVERGFLNNQGSPPPADADPARWWFERAEQMQFVPDLVSDGKSQWTFSVRTKIADGGERMEVASIDKNRMNLHGQVSRADARGAFGVLPELVGHPRINTWSSDWQARLDLAATGGPAGTILVEETPRAGGKYTSWATARNWIDPQKSSLTMRRDEIPAGGIAATKAAPPDTSSPRQLLEAARRLKRATVLEAIDRSPRGHWYPTRARFVNASIDQDGTPSDYVTHYYVDFERPIPEELFQVD